MLPTTYPTSSSAQATSRLGVPLPRLNVTLPARSRMLPGRSVSSVSVIACSSPVTAVMAAKRTARASTDWADRRTDGSADSRRRTMAPVVLGWGFSAPSTFIGKPHHRFVLNRERGPVWIQPHGHRRYAALRQLQDDQGQQTMLHVEDASRQCLRRVPGTHGHGPLGDDR